MTARGGRGSPAACPVPLPGSTSPSRGKPSGRGWASLAKRTKEGTGRDCSGHPRRPGRLLGPVPRAQQHPPAVTQGRRRKPGRHGRPGAWEARAHASSPRIIPTPACPRQGGLPAATHCSGDGGPTPRHPRHGPCEGSWGAGRLGRVAWMGAVGWVLRGLGGCGFGGCKDGGLRGWLG